MIRKSRMLIALLVVVVACQEPAPEPAATGTNNNPPASNATVTPPETNFLSVECHTVDNPGDWWVQEFTIPSSRKFVLRFSSRYKADAAIVAEGELSKFKDNLEFTGLGVFDDSYGHTSINVPEGRYYLAVRNQHTAGNNWSVELDYDIQLPASDKARFDDTHIKVSVSLNPGVRYSQDFTTQQGYRYFIDGNNTGLQCFVIPRTESEKFNNGLAINIIYTAYSGSSCGLPGLSELRLPPGSYTLGFVNSQEVPNSVNYAMERWKVE